MASVSEAGNGSDCKFMLLLKTNFNEKHGLNLPLSQNFDQSRDAPSKCRRTLDYFYRKWPDEITECQQWLDKQPTLSRRDASKLLRHLDDRKDALSWRKSSIGFTSSKPSSRSTDSLLSYRDLNAQPKTSFATINTSMSSIPPVFTPNTSSVDLLNSDFHTSWDNSFDKGTKLLVDFRLQRLPTAGFFHPDLPLQYHKLPLRVRYELQRLTCHYDVALPAFPSHKADTWSSVASTHEHLLSMVPKEHIRGPDGRSFPRTRDKIWELAAEGSWPPELHMTASLEPQAINPRTQSLFQLRLNPLAYNAKSNRFFRKFGADRFLKVMIPTPGDIRKTTKVISNSNDVEDYVLQWLNAPKKKFLGCRWIAFFNKPAKSTKKQQKQYGREARREIMFFAEEGPGFVRITRWQVINWFIDTTLNASMSANKLFARLEMGFSTTYATLVFNPSQILEIDDLYSDGAAEDLSLNDPSFDWAEVLDPNARRVMTDGCCTISFGAAQKIWCHYLGQKGPVPSAFQGRIGPYKGVWFVEHVSQDDPGDIWIKVRPSQRKFIRHAEDYGGGYDPLRLTLEVIDWSRELSRSKLYIEHLPVLEDRGIKRATLQHLVTTALQTEEEELREATVDGEAFLEWLYRTRAQEHGLDEETEEPSWCGPRKKSADDIVRSMINSGFDPQKCESLADAITTIVKYHLSDLGEELRIPIEQSTSAIGVADPFGCLSPFEIYLGCSDPKLVERAHLHGYEVLVSRSPCLRPSDVQRMRVVWKPELSHLRDVVVFPTTGSYPLAAKLQGGDYDGDRFWLCWYKPLVESFLNAPPPATDLSPEAFGIDVDRTKCADVLAKNDELRSFFEKSFRFQWQDSRLGQVTIFHEELRYFLGPGSMHGASVRLVADIHSLVIDTAKNGYTFSAKTWSQHRGKLPKPRAPPLYKQQDKLKRGGLTQNGPYRDVVDFLFFGVVQPFCEKLQEELDAQYACERFDEDIEQFAIDTRKRYDDYPELLHGMDQLEREIKQPGKAWTDYGRASQQLRENRSDSDQVTRRLKQELDTAELGLLRWYEDLCSETLRRPAFRQWRDPFGRESLTYLDLIKASILHRHWPKHGMHRFKLAGRALCLLKAHSRKGTEPIVAPLRAGYRFKSRKRASEDPLAGAVADASRLDLSMWTPGSGWGSGSAGAPSANKRARTSMPSGLRVEVFAEPSPSPAAAAADVSFADAPTEVETEPDTDCEAERETEYESAAESVFETAPDNVAALQRQLPQMDGADDVRELSQGCSQLEIDDDADDEKE